MADSNDNGAREEWKPIPGFEGSFEASTHGRIKALRRYAGKRWYEERIMRPADVFGYLKVNLSYEGKVYQRKVHTLVLQTFVGPCPSGFQCLHNDGNRKNNRLDNLGWGTAKENAEDKVRHGTVRRGERHWKAKLSAEQVREARRAYASGEFGTDIAKRMGVYNSTIYGIANGRGWKHIE